MRKKKEKAFQEIKEELMKERLLRTFDPEKSIAIQTDTSDHTTTEVLSQKGKLMELIFHEMNQAEKNYTIIEKKMLVIIQAAKKWWGYLEESITANTVITDHKNLTYFQNAWITNRRQAR